MQQSSNQPVSSTYPGDDEPQRSPLTQTTNGSSAKRAGVVAVLCIVLAAGGFVAGIQYQKGKAGTALTSQTRNGQFGGGFDGRARRAGGFGTVTAVSSTSITISKQSMAGPGGMGAGTTGSGTATTKTYSITSSTTITNDGNSASASDISVGDTVFIRTASSSSTVATAIRLNPTMPGDQTGTGSAQSSSTGSNTTSTI